MRRAEEQRRLEREWEAREAPERKLRDLGRETSGMTRRGCRAATRRRRARPGTPPPQTEG